MIKFLSKWWLKERVSWSNKRHSNDIKDFPIDETNIYTPYNVISFASEYYLKFKYTRDNWDELFDAMHSPAYCYKELKEGLLKDDCDGWHSALLHLCEKSGITAYLMTFVTKDIVGSHTVLVMKFNNKYWMINYNIMYSTDTFTRLYNRLDLAYHIVSYNFIKYNYDTGEYEIVEGGI